MTELSYSRIFSRFKVNKQELIPCFLSKFGVERRVPILNNLQHTIETLITSTFLHIIGI